MSKSSSSKERLENYRMKTYISSSNKMKPPLDASKKDKTIRAGSLKNLRKILKQKVKSSNRSWQAKD